MAARRAAPGAGSPDGEPGPAGPTSPTRAAASKTTASRPAASRATAAGKAAGASKPAGTSRKPAAPISAAASKRASARGGGGGGDLAPARFLALADEAKRAPVVIAVGDEPFFRAEVLAALERAMPAAERIDVRYERRGGEPARILDELRSGSLFAREKLVIVRDAEPFVAEAHEAIAAHAEQGPRGRVLFLELEKLDRRTRFGKQSADLGHVVLCKRLYAEGAPWQRGPQWDTELARWTADRAAARGKRLAVEDAYYLTQLTGASLHEIDQTLEKLALLLGERADARAEDIDQVAARTRRDGAFTIADAILSCEAPRALALLGAAFRHGIDAGQDAVTEAGGVGVILLGALHRGLREARRARAWLDQGGAPDPRALAEALGVAPFAAPRVLRHARALARADLDRAFRALLACDRGVKGALGPEAALVRFVAELARSAGPARPAAASGGATRPAGTSR